MENYSRSAEKTGRSVNKEAGSGVYRDKRNGSWGYRVVRGRNYRRSGFRTRSEAAAARVDFLRSLGAPDFGGRSLTLDEVFELYIKEGTLENADGTVRKRQSVYAQHISPVFGKRAVSGISAGEINLFLASCYYRSGGYSFGYVESFLKCFYAVLGFAHKKNIIGREQYRDCLIDTSSRIAMPRLKDEDALKKRGVRVYTKEEIQRIRERMGSCPERLAFELGLGCGLRISEVFALTWDDVDLEKLTLSVNKQLLYISGSWCFCRPKYAASYRTVYISSGLIELLSEEKARAEERRSRPGMRRVNTVVDRRQASCGQKASELPRICVEDFLLTGDNGKFLTTDSFKKWSAIIKSEAGISDFKFHALRHTFCSEIAALGCPVSELCRLAGHSSITTTMKYYINETETAEQAARSVLERMDGVRMGQTDPGK